MVVGALLPFGVAVPALGQPRTGSIRGVVYDRDFDAPIPAARVTILEIRQSVETTDQGNYVFPRVAPGTYTLVFSKRGYVQQVKSDVVVPEGRLAEVDAWLSGDFTEMEEFVVEDTLQASGATELGLLQLRLESPALMDSISADLMSRAGASDAASALRLVSGASLQDGKFAVIRGLPDRYVNSQMNGVRLPSADEDKRAVELDQFPSAVLESLQVSKTFTPDQQGDASGGAVNVRLKGIPEETVFSLKSQVGYNSQVRFRNDFLSYRGGGINFWGIDDGSRDIQRENLGRSWDGAVGVSEDDAPIDYKWSLSAGHSHTLASGIKIGGFANFFYERDSSFHDNGIDDSYWVVNPGDPLTPRTSQGTPQDGDFKTALFDVTQASRVVQWGGLTTLGVETDNHSVGLTFLHTRTTEDKAILAEDTRGKEFFFPGYDPDDPFGEGNSKDNRNGAPYLRTETLEYTERTAGTLQLDGSHTLPLEDLSVGRAFTFKAPEIDWTLAHSTADFDQPDKRQFGSLFLPRSFDPGFPGIIPPFFRPPEWRPFKPAANFTLGNLQRIFKELEEESNQYFADLTFPFEQWSDAEGYLKLGVFDDRVEREFDQETFSNFSDSGASFMGNFGDFWSETFPFENHPITESLFDVDYDGDQRIRAWYGMVDLPLTKRFNLIGGVRFESTEIEIVNDPEEFATWFPPGSVAPVELNPGDADVDFSQDDVLPAVALEYTPIEQVKLRAAYSETVARQTFKELTPIIQQEFLGGPIFIGNPDLQMSAVRNYDLRADYTPYDGGLLSVSWFYKDIDNPIEFVQRIAGAGFDFTTPVNFPEGFLTGFEFEARQSIGYFWDPLQGLAVGANATLIESEVDLPDDEVAMFRDLDVPMRTRDATNAPEFLYNLFLTYDSALTGTQVGVFWTVQGDTLVAGATESDGNFVPSVYAKEFGTLNVSVSQKLGKHLKLEFQGKNLTNPEIEEVFRSSATRDVTKTSFTRGREFSISLSATFRF